MKPKLIAILLLLVLLPLALLAGLGVKVARDEQEIVQHRFGKLLAAKLSDVDATITRLIEARERELLDLFVTVGDFSADPTSSIRALLRKTPAVSQIFILGPNGEMWHPPLSGPMNASERDFLARTRQVWEDAHVFYQQPEGNGAPTSAAARGWYTWYWGTGINLIFWQRDTSGTVLGAELNRARLLADIIAELPHASGPVEPRLPDARVVLADSKGAAMYQWGAYEPGRNERPRVGRPVSRPLNSWKLEYYTSGSGFAGGLGGGALFNLVSGVIVVGIALAGLAVYFYRESSREMREARQRVNFVNQVSHELKTPLTNIRMYAELLERRLDDTDEKTAQHLGVIVSQSQRLSRLITNVLTFARQQRKKLKLHTTAGNVDDIIRSVLEHFRPSLEAEGVEIACAGNAGATVKVDADVLEQVLGNLFGNVEKYAASGGWMEVRSEQHGDLTIITVADRGPGIPNKLDELVFEPFRRVSDKLTDGVAGTGIGLAIARELARLHGGDLTLEPSDTGARFRLVLNTPAAE